MADEWLAETRLGLERLIDEAVVKGATQAAVFAVVEEELARLRVAFEKDPDPADDDTQEVLEEPANDSPAASRD